jgi:hypothetical protein
VPDWLAGCQETGARVRRRLSVDGDAMKAGSSPGSPPETARIWPRWDGSNIGDASLRRRPNPFFSPSPIDAQNMPAKLLDTSETTATGFGSPRPSGYVTDAQVPTDGRSAQSAFQTYHVVSLDRAPHGHGRRQFRWRRVRLIERDEGVVHGADKVRDFAGPAIQRCSR